MKTTRVSQPVNPPDINFLNAAMAGAPPAGQMGAADPWRELAIAVATNAPTMAHACYSSSPIRKQRADVKALLQQVLQYHAENELPMSAQVPLIIGALIMGIKATGVR